MAEVGYAAVLANKEAPVRLGMLELIHDRVHSHRLNLAFSQPVDQRRVRTLGNSILLHRCLHGLADEYFAAVVV